MTKEMQIARTERKHLAKSHFFKTSMKKLAPLPRQIPGKSVDEAILQMRFSKKKVAAEVQEHLIQARNEAITVRGMGLKPGSSGDDILPPTLIVLDPRNAPPDADHTAANRLRRGVQKSESDI